MQIMYFVIFSTAQLLLYTAFQTQIEDRKNGANLL